MEKFTFDSFRWRSVSDVVDVFFLFSFSALALGFEAAFFHGVLSHGTIVGLEFLAGIPVAPCPCFFRTFFYFAE